MSKTENKLKEGKGSDASACSIIPRVCRLFGHKWVSRDGRARSGCDQECLRCGIYRDYFGTMGYGGHTAPYWHKNKTQETPAEKHARVLELTKTIPSPYDHMLLPINAGGCNDESNTKVD